MGSLVVSMDDLATGVLGWPHAGMSQKPGTVVLSLALGLAPWSLDSQALIGSL